MVSNAGIPTLLDGTRFRSRTEARWAAFFKELRWFWQYEPHDLAGYIPDFTIDHFPNLIVEVKAEMEIGDLHAEARKMMRSGWSGEGLILGYRIHNIHSGHPTIGLIGERVDMGDSLEWSCGLAELFYCINCDRNSVRAESGSWHCRACDMGDGNEHIGVVDGQWIESAWARATNRVQWRAA